MDTLEAIRKRRSIRSFKPDPIPEEDLRKMLEAAAWAPSAGNCQPLELVVVKDQRIKEEVMEAAFGQPFIGEAPVVVVICADVERTVGRYGRRGELFYVQDTAAATQNLLLAATSLGYGTCWVGAFSEDEVARVLHLPPGIRPLAIVPIGRSAEKPEAPPRRPLEEIVHRERY
ncbi:MAG: nitroreductase family protein [Candidatus Hadarchaeales archaeon]